MIQRGPSTIIAVAQQPADSFGKWRELGVNTLVDIPLWSGGDIAAQDAAWVAAANAAGLYQIRKQVGDPKTDAANPLLVAWSHLDEAEDKNIPAATLQATYNANAAFGIPWFINLDGSRVLGFQAGPDKAGYQAYMAAADFIGNDIHPVAGWNVDPVNGMNGAVSLWSVGAAIDRCRDWSGGKPQFAYIEASKQCATWLPNGGRCVTVEEFRLLIHQAIYRKVRGIIYFPLRPFAGFNWDDSPPPIKDEMIRQNAAISGAPPAQLPPVTTIELKVNGTNWRPG